MLSSFISADLRQQWRKTWQLAWPVILANLSLPLLGLADAALLGHLDASVYLAGVAAGGSLIAFVFWGFNFLSMGLSGFTSQALGAERYYDIVRQLMRYSIVAAGMVILVLVSHRLLINGGLALLALPDNVAAEANTYLTIRALGVPAIVFNAMLIGFFIGLQNTRIGLYTLTITQILNIGFNVLFVFVFDFKTAGIAMGTVISEYLGLLLILWQLKRTLHRMPIQQNPITSELFNKSQFRSIFQVSSNLFVRTFVLLSAFVWFNRTAAQFGETVIAANGLLLVFFTLISHFLDGTAAAAEAQTGHAYGQKNKRLLRQTWAVSAMLNGLFMVTLTLFFYFFGTLLLDLLTSQVDVFAIAEQHIIWVALLPLTGGIAFWLDGVFIGARRSKDMRNSVLSAFALFIFLSFVFAKSNASLWICFNAFFATRSLWLLTIFYKKLWHMDRHSSELI